MAQNPSPSTPPPRSPVPRPPFHQEFDPNIGIYLTDYQSITASPDYIGTSFEELRLENYAQARGKLLPRGSSSSSEGFSAFGPPEGLVAATLPTLWPQYQTPLFSKASAVQGRNPFASRVITFRVGGGKEEDEATAARDFSIHEELIATHSDFVRTALKKNNWKEANEGLIPLPEDDIDAFDLYQQWIYTGQIFLNRLRAPVSLESQYKLLVKAYLLGEKLLDPNFKDNIIDCIVHKLLASRTFDAKLTSLIWEHTPVTSPLRRLWLDVYMYAGNPGWLDEKALGEFVNAEFAVELGKCQMAVSRGFRERQAPFMGGGCCGYHEHGVGICYRGEDGR